MKNIFLFLLLCFLLSTGFVACQSNQHQSETVQDSLMALNSTDSSILMYADGIEKLKASLTKIESPVYSQGDDFYYAAIYEKDSIPVLYVAFNESKDKTFNEKKYYLENGALVLFYEQSKQAAIQEKSSFDFKEDRVFFRNDIFLKADQRLAKSEDLLNIAPFVLVDEYLVNKDKQADLKQIEDAAYQLGDYDLTFDRIESQSPTLKYLVMANKNSNTFESFYQVNEADSVILNMEANPGLYKGQKLKIDYIKRGKKMIFKGLTP
jgi:hypothetical protein